MLLHHFVRRRSWPAPGKRIFRRVVSVFVQLGGNPLARRKPADGRTCISLDQKLGALVQVLGGKVGTQISAVPVHRAILHHPVALKHIHAAEDIVAAKQDVVSRDDFCGHRRLVAVNQVGEYAEDGKAEEISQQRALKPARRDRHRFSRHNVPPP